MKKIIINPGKDTVTLCLPQNWIGRTVICTLREPGEEEDVEVMGMASEDSIFYQAARYKKLAKRRPRNKRLRRKYL